jgi:hypothetical protein
MGSGPDEQHLIDAVRAAAGVLRAAGPLPPASENVLRFAVRDQLRAVGLGDVGHEQSKITGGWSPVPGNLDLYTPKVRPHRWALEAKVWDVDQQIWDAIKLAAGIAHGDLRVGYLLAAAPPTAFAHYDGAELYAPGTHAHSVWTLLDANPRAWQHLLDGGAGRPTEVPTDFSATLLVDEWCWFGHRVRLVRIECVADKAAPTLRFEDGWPVGMNGRAAVAAAKARPRRRGDDALGLLVGRWTDAWWEQQRHDGVSRDQFEALYGLLLLRRWTDADIRLRVPAPPGCAPAWWNATGAHR